MSNKNNEVMKQQNDVNNRYSEFENRPKFNWSILVFVILGLIGVVLFAPISDKRSYSDTTQNTAYLLLPNLKNVPDMKDWFVR